MRIIHNIYILRCSAAPAQTTVLWGAYSQPGGSDNSCQTMIATFNLDSRFQLEFPHFYNSTCGKLLPFRAEYLWADCFDLLSRHCQTLKSGSYKSPLWVMESCNSGFPKESTCTLRNPNPSSSVTAHCYTASRGRRHWAATQWSFI